MNPLPPSAIDGRRSATVPGRVANGPRPASATVGVTQQNSERSSKKGSQTTADTRPIPTGPLVSVIIPTYNEAGNIAELLGRLGKTLAGQRYEIFVVDDSSPDGTWRVAERLGLTDNRIRVIRRTEDRGLSSAVLAGMHAASGDVLVVIDADLQHDEQKIPALVAAIDETGVDICLGSREIDGGSYGSFRRRRRLVSWAGGAMARQLLGLPVSDPMSGFFAVSKQRFEAVSDQVNPRGFKIMLELLARGPKPEVAEVGYRFGERVSGSTKLTGSVGMEYLRALGGLMLHRANRRARRATQRPRAATEK